MDEEKKFKQQEEVDKIVAKAIRKGMAHVYYGLIVLMVLTVIQVLIAEWIMANIKIFAVVLMIEFGIEAGIFADLFAHGYTH